MAPTGIDYPRLRPVDVRPFAQNGRQYFALHDPLQLCDQTQVVPQPLHLVLALCDGTRLDAQALGASLSVRYGVQISPSAIEQLLHALDKVCLLENETYFEACTRVLDDYRRATFRSPASAGLSYPGDPAELRELLDSYINALPASTDSISGDIRGLVSPHIDYARGGPIYAQVWREVKSAAMDADLVLILGTDHNGSAGSMTLTRQHYATPYGILPTAVDAVDHLAESLGPAACFTEELHHRAEHSIELAAVWLHHVREGEPCQMVPILCGSFYPYIQASDNGPAKAATDARLGLALQTLGEIIRDRNTLVVAAADLAHVGPAFGGRPLDMAGRAQVQSADDALLAQVCGGSAEGFLDEIRHVGDRYNVCGTPPIYLALRLLEPVQGSIVSYDLCLADEQGTSQVSACGVVLHS